MYAVLHLSFLLLLYRAISRRAPPPHVSLVLLKLSALSTVSCWAQALRFCKAPRDNFDCNRSYKLR